MAMSVCEPVTEEEGLESVLTRNTQIDGGMLRSDNDEQSLTMGHHEYTPSDIVVLYYTLVQDGALPPGFETSFAALGPYIFPEAERQLRHMTRLDNISASVALHQYGKECKQMEQVEKKATEQFLAAALNKPKVYKTRLQRSFYETATARLDSEEAERVRWVSELCTLLCGTNPVQNRSLERTREQLLYVPVYAWRGDILHGFRSIIRLLSQTV